MVTTFKAIFDGEVLRPETPLDLELNTIYTFTLQGKSEAKPESDAWDVLEEMIGTVEGPPDWSLEHDHYIHGTPKRYSDEAE